MDLTNVAKPKGRPRKGLRPIRAPEPINLQTMAFLVFFKELVCKATPDTVDFVRSCIDQQLMGTMKKTIREKCLNALNEWFKSQKEDDSDHQQHQQEDQSNGQLLDVSVILDCILDCNFLELELVIPFPSLQSFSSLLSVISRRCPQLESLTIRFKHIGTEKSQVTSPIIKPVVLPLTPLSCLTKLSLWHGFRARHNNPDCGFIFSIVGKCFPVLSKFCFEHFHLRKMDVIKLIVKEELADILFAPTQDDEGWSEDSVLVSLRIPTDYLNPACFTLNEMYGDSACYPCTPSGRCDCNVTATLSFAPLAFALRHLTRLHSMNITPVIGNWTTRINRLLYKAPRNEKSQAAFEKDCREAALRVGFKSASSTLLTNDFVLLKQLIIGIDALIGGDEIWAVGSLCSHLKSIEFNGLGYIRYDSIDEMNGMVSPDQFGEILKDWPKLLEIHLCGIIPELIQIALLNNFATSLQVLELWDCHHIDLTLSSICTHLKRLVIHEGSLKPGVMPPASWNSENYLPNLEELMTVELCLETWAPLFEGKRTLKKLKLSCCHIGTKQAGVSEVVPDLWSGMESFSLTNLCTGLTMAMVAELFPKLGQLRSITLPESMMKKEPEATKQLTNKLSQKKEPVEITSIFYRWCDEPCPFQRR